MAIHLEKFELHKEAMHETLIAVDELINYSKTAHTTGWNNDDEGCLGYPAAILLFSFVNAFGNLFYGEVIDGVKVDCDKKTFGIIKLKYFNNSDIDSKVLEAFYESYRSKLVHNLTLPAGYYLKIGKDNSEWYSLANSDKGEPIINTLFLFPFLTCCKNAFLKLQTEHKEKFTQSIKIIDISYKDNSSILSNDNISMDSSGTTHYQNPLKFKR
ncbi:MAG: hypothetical protein HYU69_01725 [Bacteroidetes bacterium]|nr:hypothetical protein [Bacteroidota bacterium]